MKWLISILLFLTPFLTVGSYSILESYFRDLNVRYLPVAIYALSVALASTFTETQLFKKILRSVVPTIISLFLWGTFDVVMILGIFGFVGFFAVGISKISDKVKWKNYLLSFSYRIVRVIIGWILLFLTLMLPLSRSGRCPEGGGDIVETFGTFLIVTYIPLSGIIIFDMFVRKRLFIDCLLCRHNSADGKNLNLV